MWKRVPANAGRQACCLVLVALAQLGAASAASADVTVGVSRAEALYSSDAMIDCSKLHAITDDTKLPFNVVRLRAAAVGETGPVTFHWSMLKPAAGTLAADLDLGPTDQTAAIDGMCAEFGNACVLTADRLRFYTESSILWVAPTCDALPHKTAKPFPGGATRLRLKATSGKRKIGVANVTLGYGHDGSVTLSAWNGTIRDHTVFVFEDGIGSTSGVAVPANAIFGAKAVLPTVAPGPITTYEFDNGAGGTETVNPGCNAFSQFDACAEVDYRTAGRFLPHVAARFDDGSALCDNVADHVLQCSGKVKLDVDTKPKLGTYDPAKPGRDRVHLVVRVRNQSRATEALPACIVVLRGQTVLSCTEDVHVGGVKDSKTTMFDLPHCSETADIPCLTNPECAFPRCRECVADEVCLTGPHCSGTVRQACTHDSDCSMPACPHCADNETCVHVINSTDPELVIAPGDSLDIVTEDVVLKNAFGDTAQMSDTWTLTPAFPVGVSDETTVRYRIRGRPQPTSPGQ